MQALTVTRTEACLRPLRIQMSHGRRILFHPGMLCEIFAIESDHVESPPAISTIDWLST